MEINLPTLVFCCFLLHTYYVLVAFTEYQVELILLTFCIKNKKIKIIIKNSRNIEDIKVIL